MEKFYFKGDSQKVKEVKMIFEKLGEEKHQWGKIQKRYLVMSNEAHYIGYYVECKKCNWKKVVPSPKDKRCKK